MRQAKLGHTHTCTQKDTQFVVQHKCTCQGLYQIIPENLTARLIIPNINKEMGAMENTLIHMTWKTHELHITLENFISVCKYKLEVYFSKQDS